MLENSYGEVVMLLLSNGMFLMGKDEGSGVISRPRMFQLVKEYLKDKDGKTVLDDDGNPVPKLDDMGNQIMLSSLSPLPGIPTYVDVKPVVSYVVTARNRPLLDLYARVTNPRVDPGDPPRGHKNIGGGNPPEIG